MTDSSRSRHGRQAKATDGERYGSLGRYLDMDGMPVSDSAFRLYHKLVYLSDAASGMVPGAVDFRGERTALTQDVLAAMLGKSKMTINKGFRELESIGALQRMRPSGERKGQRNHQDRWRLRDGTESVP